MRAEDRKPSKRVFPLLQNLDLDSVTFAQISSTGESITIQDMNEQEMLDLIIVNLARLCVESEWTGLLEAGGGAPDNAVMMKLPPISNSSSTNLPQYAHISAPYGTGYMATQAVNVDSPLYEQTPSMTSTSTSQQERDRPLRLTSVCIPTTKVNQAPCSDKLQSMSIRVVRNRLHWSPNLDSHSRVWQGLSIGWRWSEHQESALSLFKHPIRNTSPSGVGVRTHSSTGC